MTLERIRLKSSGDPLADRRYGYGAMLRAAGDLRAAADLFIQTLELAPGWIAAWMALAEVRHELGDRDGAIAAWREALRLDPTDPMGAELKLALAGGVAIPAAAPEGYVRALFDDYAAGFEAALLGRLAYAAPVAIRDAVEVLCPGARFGRGLDLGCGTGLAGEALRSRVGWLEGVDLSSGMIDQARAKRVFDALHVAEAVRFLAAETRQFDLVIAADVVPYLGDLGPLFGLVAERLAEGGMFVFSVELVEEMVGPGWRLQPSARYAHTREYLQQTGAAAGFALAGMVELTLRLDRAMPVPGAVLSFVQAGARVATALPLDREHAAPHGISA